MVFVTSDIHGEYDKFIEILKQIQLKDTDTLYVLGDVVDRGPHPIKVLLKLMEMPIRRSRFDRWECKMVTIMNM